MGQKGTAKQIKDGLYWLSSPSLEAVKVINALEDKSRALIVGACNGIWFDGIRKGVSVDQYDLFPRGGGVHFHPCNGSPFFPGSEMNKGASSVKSKAFEEKLAIVGKTHLVSIYFPGTPAQSLPPHEAFKTFQAISAILADRFSDSFNLLTNGGATTRMFQGYQISLVLKPEPIPSSTSSVDGSTASSPLAAVTQATTSSSGAGLITTFLNSAQATPSSNSEDFHQTLPTLSSSPVVYQAWTKGWHKLQPHLGSSATIPPTHGQGGLLTGVQGAIATLTEIGEKMRAQFDAVTPIWRTKHGGETGFVFGFYKIGSDAPPVIVADKDFNAEFSRTGISYSVGVLRHKLKKETKRETPITCTDNGYVIFTSWEN